MLDKEGKIVIFNSYMEQLTGYKLNEVKGKDWFSTFLPKCYYNKIKKVFKEAVSDIPTDANVNPILTKKGEERLIEWHSKTLKDSNGKTMGIISIGQDITEYKKSEEEKALLQKQLFQSQKMESIGVLAGGIAHDFNNILTAIMGEVEFLLKESDLSQKLKPDLESIKKSADRAADLVSQLLLFSRKDMSIMKTLDLNEVLRNSAKMIKRIIGEQITVHLDISNEKYCIDGDKGNIEQVLVNLAVNARDAMAEGGKLTISTSKCNLSKEDILNLQGL